MSLIAWLVERQVIEDVKRPVCTETSSYSFGFSHYMQANRLAEHKTKPMLKLLVTALNDSCSTIYFEKDSIEVALTVMTYEL